MKKAIECRNLSKSFRTQFYKPATQVLNQVTFDVIEGHTTGFVGVNGSGKTTTLKSLLRFILAETGDIQFFGRNYREEGIQRTWGFLPERPYYPHFLTAWEFLQFHWNLSGATGNFEKRATELLTQVDLIQASHQRLKSFSKGMLQRAGLAQALLASPKLLILDEPMSGLDPDGRFAVKEILKAEKIKGTTLFFSSHLLSDMEELCDDLVVIDRGKIIFNGPMKDFLETESNLEISFQKRRHASRDKNA